MSRCKACDAKMVGSELASNNPITKEPEDLCGKCKRSVNNANSSFHKYTLNNPTINRYTATCSQIEMEELYGFFIEFEDEIT